MIVPLFPSHFSALGMLLADERHDFTRTVYSDLASVDFGKLVKIHDEMVKEAKAGLRHGKDAQYQINLDIRYVGQEFTLPVPVTLDAAQARRPQGDPHRVRRALRAPLRAPFAGGAGGDGQHPARRHRQAAEARVSEPWRVGRRPQPAGERQAYFSSASKPLTAKVYRRDTLGAGAEIAGPALIQEHGTTTVLFETRPLPGGAVRRTDRHDRRRAMTCATQCDAALAVPSPACGGGTGRGRAANSALRLQPPPQPSPASGGGSRRCARQ